MPREILLVGGGHAHVEVIRRYGKNPIRDSRLTVLDPNPYPIYSGMVPGFVAGQYERQELEAEKLLDVSLAVPLHVVVGGAGGIELAFCLQARLERRGAARPFSTITSDPCVLESSAPAVRRRVEQGLARRRINVITNTNVEEVRANSLRVSPDRLLPSSGAVWVTGPAAHSLPANSSLPIDSRGFVRIQPTLQVQGFSNLFAVGDCASLPGMKKAGVYAVRAGPLLDENLRALAAGDPRQHYKPQDDFLSLLNLGAGTAIGSKWGIALEGRAMMWIKDRIDRSFMEKCE